MASGVLQSSSVHWGTAPSGVMFDLLINTTTGDSLGLANSRVVGHTLDLAATGDDEIAIIGVFGELNFFFCGLLMNLQLWRPASSGSA